MREAKFGFDLLMFALDRLVDFADAFIVTPVRENCPFRSIASLKGVADKTGRVGVFVWVAGLVFCAGFSIKPKIVRVGH
jgi:hypothetical protein